MGPLSPIRSIRSRAAVPHPEIKDLLGPPHAGPGGGNAAPFRFLGVDRPEILRVVPAGEGVLAGAGGASGVGRASRMHGGLKEKGLTMKQFNPWVRTG